MSTSGERAMRYKERQKAAGRKPVVIYLQPETIAKLRELARGRPRGEVVERAVADHWNATKSANAASSA